jgi:small subunit ribosomal protein S27e
MASRGRGKFLKVTCLDCDNEQIVFNRAASTVQCIICGKTIVKPKGGKSDVFARVTEVVR